MRFSYRERSRSIFAQIAIVLTITPLAISVAGASPTSLGPVRTSSPVIGLGVDGSLAGYTEGCGELHAWSPATGRITRIRKEVVDCSGTGSYGDVAIASDEVVWAALEEHNHLYLGVHVARVTNPTRVRTLYDVIDEDVGALAAEGSVVAFSTQGGVGYSGPRATLWAGTTSRVSALARAAGWMDRVAVEGDLVALGYRDGRVRLFQASGTRIRALPAGIAVNGLVLDRGRLLALAGGRVSVRTPGGRIVLSRRIRGTGARAELMDAEDGLVVYRVGSTLRLLRLADGRDVLIQTPKTPVEYLHAGFGASGLVVAHLAAPSRPARGGVVRLLHRRELDQLLARGS